MNCLKPSDHQWVPLRGGRERCTVCKTEFPCAHECKHYLDCWVAKGLALPEWIQVVEQPERKQERDESVSE